MSTFQDVFKKQAKNCILFQEYPEEMLDAILEEPEEAAAYALAYLDKALKDPDLASIDDDAYGELMCALAIVTGLKEKKAFPLVLQFSQGEIPEALLGDAVTEVYPDMISRTFDGNVDAVVATVTGEETDEFASEAILRAMGAMKRIGILAPEEYRSFMDAVFEAHIEDPLVMTGAISSMIEAGAADMAYRVDEVDKAGLLDELVVGNARECKEQLSAQEYATFFYNGDLVGWFELLFG